MDWKKIYGGKVPQVKELGRLEVEYGEVGGEKRKERSWES